MGCWALPFSRDFPQSILGTVHSKTKLEEKGPRTESLDKKHTGQIRALRRDWLASSSAQLCGFSCQVQGQEIPVLRHGKKVMKN